MNSILHKAMKFAIRAHGDQKYGPYPYVYHLIMVDEVLYKYGYFANKIRSAAYLHDILEDTKITKRELENEFDEIVANWVYLITNEPGKNRKERHEKTYPKIRTNPFAVALKLADRIANVSFSIETNNDGMMKMYRKEHEEFKKALWKEYEYMVMWDELDNLLKENGQ